MSSSSDESEGVPGPSSGAPKKRKYSQAYREDWEAVPDFKGWLAKSRKGKTFAMCKTCDKDINITSGKDALIKHAKSKSHQDKARSIQSQISIKKFTVDMSGKRVLEDKVKEGEQFILFFSDL